MRKSFSNQQRLDCDTIENVQLNLNCRDEIIPILAALQHVYSKPELRDSILSLVAGDVNSDSRRDIGREGFDDMSGVLVGAQGTGNTIRGNSIHSNVGVEIDAGLDGITLNDPADADAGPNGLQNYPVISYVSDGPSTQVVGSLTSQPNTTYIIDFYASASASVGIREGQTHLHEISVTSNATGLASIDVTLPNAVDPQAVVTATATDPVGNTSEFSAGLRPEAVLTTITMPFDGNLSVAIYDDAGQIVRTVREASFELAGEVNIGWDGRNDFGLEMPTGQYEWRALYSQAQAVDDGQVGDSSDQPYGISEHSNAVGAVAVDTFGNVYETSAWEEAHFELRKWDANGHAVWGINFVEGGKAIAVDDTYVYATRDAQNSNRVERFHAADGTPAPWASPSGGHIVVNTSTDAFQGKVFGLSADSARLWVSNNLENRVELYDVATGAFLDQFTVSDPKGVVADWQGNAWVAHGSAGVTLFDVSGTVIREVLGVDRPYSVALGPPSDGSSNDNLYVGAVGSSQVLEFNLDTPTPTHVRSLFGAAEPGPIFPDRLYWSIMQSASLAVDSTGRMVVADGGNKRVQTYNADGTLLRTRFSEFQPAPFVDPNVDPDMMLSTYIQYDVDYNTGEWMPSHNWLPADLDLWSARAVRRRLSNGQDYLFYLGSGGVTTVYALETTGMRRSAIIGADTTGAWNWTDSDGDGVVEAAEKTFFNDVSTHDFQTLAPGLWIDESGSAWIANWDESIPGVGNAGKTVRLSLEGFDAHGNPLYDWSQRQDAVPADTSFWHFTPRNMRVHPGNDEIYLIGNTSRNDDNGGVFWMGGTAVDRRAADGSRIMLLPISGAEGQDVIHGSSQRMVAIATGDDPDYFYTGHAAGPQHWVRMYTTDGLLVTTGIIGPNNGSHGGWIDHGMGIAAFTHPASGVHYVYAEEVFYGKSIRYRVDDLHTVGRTQQSFQWNNPLFHVTNTLDDGVGSLRRAIENANDFPGHDTITFDIPGAGVHTISPSSAFPMITDTVTIDGTSQPGHVDTPLIELHGGNITAPGTARGFLIAGPASGSAVRGLTINGFSGAAIRTHGYPDNITIEDNFLGTDPTGSFAVPNHHSGIELTGSSHHVIGNLISGNVGDGISAGEAHSLVIQENRIGTDSTGNSAIPNGSSGIGFNQVGDSLIGGSGIGEGNLISGNTRDGILLGGLTNTTGNAVYGNWIGTDVSGTVAIPNGSHGVHLKQSAAGNFVGTNGDGVNDELEGNLISGNAGTGVYITGESGNIIAGNLIGTQLDGNSALPNARAFTILSGSNDTRIGTNGDGVSDAVERNVIAANSSGIKLHGDNTIIAGNLIGVGLAGAQLGNGGYGIRIYGASNRVGTDGDGIADADEANVVAYNPIGVIVSGSTGNTIRGNSIHSNLYAGIDLGNDGLTINDTSDADSGSNQLQNFPVITSAARAGATITVAGTLHSASSATFEVDFYANAVAHPSGYGGGETYLGSTNVTTDANGDTSFTATLSASVPVGHFLTATATDSAGNTSEFSLAEIVVQGNSPPVATNDSPVIDEDTDLNGHLAPLASDPDGDPLTFQLLTGASHGSVVINPHGTYTYTPNANYHGVDSFDYQVFDGEFTAAATVNITINPINDPATITGTVLGFTDEDGTTPVTGALSVADADVDEDQFVPQTGIAGSYGTFEIDATGNWTYTLNPASVQHLAALDEVIDSFSVESLDGTASQVVNVTIAGNNDAAVIGGDVARVTNEDELSELGTLTITDVDAGEGSFVPQQGTGGNHGAFDLDAAGNWTYALDTGSLQTLTANDQLVDVFIVESDDGTTSQITFTINGLNDAPVITSANVATLPENTHSVLVVSATDVEQPPQTLTFSMTGNGADDALFQISGGNQLEFITAPDFENPLDAGADNVYEVELQVDDGHGLTAIQTVTVNVSEVNDNAPAFTSAGSLSVAENSTAVQTVSASDADLPAQSITLSITGNGADDALFQITGGDHLEFIAPPNFENRMDADINNVYEVELQADDGHGLTTTTTVYITVTDVVEPHSIYVLNESRRGALSLSGHAEITVGDIFVNSDSSNAIRASGHSSINVNSVNVVGGVRATGDATIDPAPTALAAAVVDPLANMPAPTPTGPNHGSIVCWGNQSRTLSPGTYSRIWAAGHCEINMLPGEYTIEGGGIIVVGHASLTGHEVSIFNTSDQHGWYGGIFLAGQGTFDLTPPVSGDQAGVVIFQDRYSWRRITLAGHASMAGIQGTIYAPSAKMSLNGHSQTQATLIVDRLRLRGGAGASLVTDDMTGSETDFITEGQLLRGEVVVALGDANGELTVDEWERFGDGLQTMNVAFADYGVTLVEAESSDVDYAHVQITIDSTSACGGMAEGVLGCTEASGAITLIDGWNWYTGVDPTQIASGQYDFLTVLTHELGHVLGLGHSQDASSVMNSVLGGGEIRRELTAADLDFVAQHEDMEPLLAEGFAIVHDHGPHAGELHEGELHEGERHDLEQVDAALQALDTAFPHDEGPASWQSLEQATERLSQQFRPQPLQANLASALPWLTPRRRGWTLNRMRTSKAVDALFASEDEVWSQSPVDLHSSLGSNGYSA